MPHSALGARTPDEVFRGEAADLQERVRAASGRDERTHHREPEARQWGVFRAPTVDNTTSGEQYRKGE
jgi:hypothetical protein